MLPLPAPGRARCSDHSHLPDRYKGRWENFERDMLLVFENARTYNAEGSQVYEDATALETLFRSQPQPGVEGAKVTGGGAKRRRSSEEDGTTAGGGGGGGGAAAAAASAAKPAKKPAAAAKPAKKAAVEVEAAAAAAAAAVVPSKPKAELMLEAWDAVRNATDAEGRERADIFVTLPPKEELPEYYDIIRSPIDLRSIKEKIDEGGYRRWDNFERDMLLVFENARTYNMEGSEVHEDATALEQVFRSQPTPAGGGGAKAFFDPSVEGAKPQLAQELAKRGKKRRR
jgi:hypothetical protein